MLTLNDLKAIKKNNQVKWIKDYGLNGIDIGNKLVGNQRTTELSIRVFVEKKDKISSLGNIIPPTIYLNGFGKEYKSINIVDKELKESSIPSEPSSALPFIPVSTGIMKSFREKGCYLSNKAKYIGLPIKGPEEWHFIDGPKAYRLVKVGDNNYNAYEAAKTDVIQYAFMHLGDKKTINKEYIGNYRKKSKGGFGKELLFDVSQEFQIELDEKKFSKGLRQEFEKNEIELSEDIPIEKTDWRIKARQIYVVKKEEEMDQLNIYKDGIGGELLFSVGQEFQTALDGKTPLDGLRQEFKNNKIELPNDISIEKTDNTWQIKAKQIYVVEKIAKLNIYKDGIGGELLFSVGQEFQTALDGKTPLDGLRQEFKNNKIELPNDISIEKTDNTWQIKDRQQIYVVKKETDKLSIYRRYIPGVSGTLGAIVKEKGSDRFGFLTCRHAVSEDFPDDDDDIIKPTFPSSKKDYVAVVIEKHIIGGIVGYTSEIEKIGRIREPVEAQLGMEVRKHGNTTGLTYGTVVSIDLTAIIDKKLLPDLGDFDGDKLKGELNNGHIPEEIKTKINEKISELSGSESVKRIDEKIDDIWQIEDGLKTYIIEKEGNKLKIYSGKMFDGQIGIVADLTKNWRFGYNGDSGSLIVNNMLNPIGLLVACNNETGIGGGKDRNAEGIFCMATPIQEVLDNLGVDIYNEKLDGIAKDIDDSMRAITMYPPPLSEDDPRFGFFEGHEICPYCE